MGNTIALLDPVGDGGSSEVAQGRTREIIAVWLLGLVCAIVGLAFTGYFLTLDGTEAQNRFTNLKALLDVLVGPIITLLSSAIGFYFGSRTGQAGGSRGASRGGVRSSDGGGGIGGAGKADTTSDASVTGSAAS